MDEEWVAETAEVLERVTRDPMANAARGTVRILAVSEPVKRRGYQPCTMRLALVADGIDEEIDYEGVFPANTWPVPGRMLPGRISRRAPRIIEVDWQRAVE